MDKIIVAWEEIGMRVHHPVIIPSARNRSLRDLAIIILILMILRAHGQ